MENDGEKKDKSKNLKLAALFGVLFGFLLQKGGVAKYHVLERQLLLEDFTVIKIMITAIFTGLLGHYYQVKTKKVSNAVKPYQPYANIIGGAIFGIGFAMAGFCPGTGAAALGQGDFEALYYMGGMVAGSYIFAESSAFLTTYVNNIKDYGELTLDGALKLNTAKATALTAILLAGVLIILKMIT